MKTTKLFVVGLFFVSLVMQSCDPATTTPTEFIANNNTFAGFTNWSLVGTKNGVDPALGIAHAGNDSTSTRKIYFKDNQDPVDGVYPVGTLIAKHVYNSAGTVEAYMGMAKRGNGFSPNHNDWEWFILNADGSIQVDATSSEPKRGANLGSCATCHSGAATDYSFAK